MNSSESTSILASPCGPTYWMQETRRAQLVDGVWGVVRGKREQAGGGASVRGIRPCSRLRTANAGRTASCVGAACVSPWYQRRQSQTPGSFDRVLGRLVHVVVIVLVLAQRGGWRIGHRGRGGRRGRHDGLGGRARRCRRRRSRRRRCLCNRLARTVNKSAHGRWVRRVGEDKGDRARKDGRSGFEGVRPELVRQQLLGGLFEVDRRALVLAPARILETGRKRGRVKREPPLHRLCARVRAGHVRWSQA